MDNMDSARQSLLEALNEAERGAAFYRNRVQALELVLHTLNQADGIVFASTPASKRLLRKDAEPSERSGQAKVPKTAALPSTGVDFWMSILSSQEQTMAQLFERTLTVLRKQGTQLTDEQAAKIRGRLSVALFAMSKSGQVSSNGAGRTRTYFTKTKVERKTTGLHGSTP